jgi:protein TonB
MQNKCGAEACGEVSMFESLKDCGRRNAFQYLTSLLISLVAHTAVLAALVIFPLLFFNVLHADELITILIDPPGTPVPPAPPVPPAKHRPSAGPKVFTADTGAVPPAIPKGISVEIEPPEATGIDTLLRGVGDSSPGVTTGPSITEILKLNEPVSRTPPPPPPPHPPIRVSGPIQEANLIRRIAPVYPPLAIQARVSGTVILEAVIDEDGNVGDLKILSGHPLLTQAAYDAVKQWKYRPTTIGGEPVPVLAVVTVVFRIR